MESLDHVTASGERVALAERLGHLDTGIRVGDASEA
jgi:hypothetical protein